MPESPRRFGKYVLLQRMNVGGMAEVFLGKAFGIQGFEKLVAIKRILPAMAEDDEFITMFVDEARISAQLSHSNIVQIFELGKEDDSYFIAMEYVLGKDLYRLLQHYRSHNRAMPIAQAAYIASEICAGLDYAHRKRDSRGAEMLIVHRDVTPSNVLLSYEGEVKITDFGIAKAADRSQKTQPGILKGKFGYMSPELLRGLPVDRRSDVFAVGIILYEMLTGVHTFMKESNFGILEKIRSGEVQPPRLHNPEISADLEKVVLKALAREVEDRYQWCSDLQEDLVPFLRSSDAVYSRKHLAAAMREAFGEARALELAQIEAYATPPAPAMSAQAQSAPLFDLGVRLDAAPGPRDYQTATGPAMPAPSLDGDPWSALGRSLPEPLQGDAASIVKFLRALFETITSLSGPWQLHGPKQSAADCFEFYALFIAERATPGGSGQVGERTFVEYTSPLEQHLTRLAAGSSKPKVVLVVTNAAELGQGVRRKILKYRTESKLLLLPLYVGELRTAVAKGLEADVFGERIADLHGGREPYSAKAPMDATRFFGMRSALNQLVEALATPGALVSVHGPPGAGKTTLVNRAELDWSDGIDHFLWVRCANLDEPSVDEVVRDIAARMRSRFPDWIPTGEISQSKQTDLRLTMINAVPPSGAQQRPTPVLVLEDADWLIQLLESQKAPEATAQARRFWKTVAEWSNTQTVRTVVTSVRGFVLAERRIRGWENPLASHLRSICVPPLDLASMGAMIRELGIDINVSYTPWAIEKIHRLSGGRVEIARKLCHQIVQESRGKAPLASHEVEASNVERAAECLVAIGGTFRDTWEWLEDAERTVLREVACSRPRSIRKVKRALETRLADADVERAAERLRMMGFVERTPKRREEVGSELFSRWIREHVEVEEEAPPLKPTRRLRWVALGCTVTVLLFAAYFGWATDQRSRRDLRDGDCTYTITYPPKSAPGEKHRFLFTSRCESQRAAPALGMMVQNGTDAVIANGEVVFLPDAMGCEGPRGCRPVEHSIELRAPEPGTRIFAFQLLVNGIRQHPDLMVRVDELRATKQLFARAVEYGGAVPLLLGLLLTFYKDILTKLQQLVSLLGRKRREIG